MLFPYYEKFVAKYLKTRNMEACLLQKIYSTSQAISTYTEKIQAIIL